MPSRATTAHNKLLYMRNKIILSFAAAGVLLLSSACASITTSGRQDITFKGVPGTHLKDADKNVSLGSIGDNGFATINLKNQLKGKRVEAVKDGYTAQNFMLDSKIRGRFWWNIFLGIIPAAIDVATGKMMVYSNDVYDVTLQKDENAPAQAESVVAVEQQPQPQTQPTGQVVNRNTPGTTDMEKAIIRWYIDSEPRGARISWRVISNVPAEVKNTNETYMTTTPLEETRSLNILGLTYENSNNVTIEVKIEKRGYETQVKRYNVRMALDQQEISSFFELVPKIVKNYRNANSTSSKSTKKK